MEDQIKLPSGRMLKITLADFTSAKPLYKAILKEAKSLTLHSSTEMDYNFFKDVFCSVLISDEIEDIILNLCKRATIDGLKIDDAAFEKEDHRGDYIFVLKEVGLKNLLPFLKPLIAELSQMINQTLGYLQELESKS